MNPLEILVEIQRAVEDVQNMNQGGCAVFAAFISRRLEKYGIKTCCKIGQWFCTIPEDALDKARQANARRPCDYNSFGISFGHLIVEFEWEGQKYHFDSEGLIPAAEKTQVLNLPIYSQSMTPKECLLIARSREGWNCSFQRNQIPEILKKVSAVFRKHSSNSSCKSSNNPLS